MSDESGLGKAGPIAPMGHRPSYLPISSLLAGFTLLVGCNGSGGGGNAAPRVSSIPQQRVTSGTALSLDVGSYVLDREAQSLAFTVTAGGGDFLGSAYSNIFPTMGHYTVQFTVTDAAGKQSASAFDVDVTTGDYVVVREGASGLLLGDTNSNELLRISGAASGPQYAVGLSDGRAVYQNGNPRQLWIFDPMARSNVRLAANTTGDVTYLAKTADNRIVYTTEGTTRRLHVYNPRTQLTRSIAENVPATGAVLVGAGDLIYFTLLDGVQGDVRVYDPAADTVTTIAATEFDERLSGVLPNGGLVFSRIGANGEHDLFYWKSGIGLVEVASTVTALDSLDKAFATAGSANQVVFTGTDGTTTGLWSWSPLDDSLTAISTGTHAAFAAIGAGNEVLYTVDNGGGDVDASWFDLDDATAAVVRNSADVTTVLGIAGTAAQRYAIVQGSGDPSSIAAVALTAAPTTIAFAGGGAMQFALVLANGDALAQRTDGTTIAVFDGTAGAFSTIAGTGLAVAGPGTDAGDFVYAQTASAQQDLAMWDASAAAPVLLSTTAGDDVWQATTNGKIYFTRSDVTGHAQLHVHAVATGVTLQLTRNDAAGVGFDHVVTGTYRGTR